jgi:Zn-dependent protease with chaperone function
MTQLLPIILIGIVLIADRRPISEGWGDGAAVLVALGPVALIVAVAALALHGCRRRLIRAPSVRSILVADRVVSLGRWLIVATHATAVLFGGWLAAVRHAIGDLVLVDETVAILPPVAGLVALWWLHYPIERRVREALLIRRIDAGQPLFAVPTRGRYVLVQTRLHLLLLLVPLLLFVGLAEVIQHLGELPDPPVRGWVIETATTAAGLSVFAIAPLLARLVLSLEPLEAGPVRDDLEDVCRRHRIRVRGFLLWRTDGSIINAAVMGIAAPLRYVLLTDALVEMVSRDEVRAVMAHEIGHVRRHHMPWLILALMAALLTAGFVVGAPTLVLEDRLEPRQETLAWIDGGRTVAVAALALLAFGWLSRRFERQADTFAVQHLSGLGTTDPDGDAPAVTGEAVATMQGALEAVARLNTVDPRRRSWRHGSIAWRQAYLATTIGQRVDELSIDRLVRRLKLAVALILVAGLTTIVVIEQSAGADVDREPVPEVMPP